MTNKTHLIIRLSVAALVLVCIYFAIDRQELVRITTSISLQWSAYALGLIFVIRILMALRWQYILSIYNIPTKLSEIISVIFISNSLGHILPSGLGTDIIRGHHVVKNHGNTAHVSATIILDRVIGMYSMLSLAFIGSCISTILFEGSFRLAVILGCVNIAFVVLTISMHSLCSQTLRLNKLQRIMPAKIWSVLNRVIIATSDLTVIKRIFIPIFSISILVQLTRCLVFFCLYYSIGYPLGLLQTIIYIPFIFVIMLVPVSIGGLGIRESALIFSFSQFGIPPEANITSGLLFHLLQIVVIIPGLLCFIFQRKK